MRFGFVPDQSYKETQTEGKRGTKQEQYFDFVLLK